jgi:hypothetical protein
MNDQFGMDPSLAETLYLYGGDVVLEWYPDPIHAYCRVEGNERYIASGVTSVCQIYDKSAALKPWAANMTAQHIIDNIPCEGLVRYELAGLYAMLKDKKELPPKPRNFIQTTTEDLAKLCNEARRQYDVVTKDAASVGKVAHEWLERYIKAKLNGVDLNEPMPQDKRSASCVEAALGFFDRHKVEFVYSERKIYSRRYNFAGTADLLAWVTSCGNPKCCPFEGRVLELDDFKTSNDFRDDYPLQTAAYKYALLEEFEELCIAHRRIMKLGKEDGDFKNRVFPAESFEGDFAAFLGLLQTYNWKQQGVLDRAVARGYRRYKPVITSVTPIKTAVVDTAQPDIPIEPEKPKTTKTRTKKDGIPLAI